jgi:hypothetical protein
MRTSAPWRGRFLAVLALSIIALAWGGCSPSEEKPREPSRHPDATPQAPVALSAPESTARPKHGPTATPEAAAKHEAGPSPAKAAPPEEVVTKELEEIQSKPPVLGQPLVDDFKSLQRLQPRDPIWLDPKNRHVVLLGEACKPGYPLEFFATYSSRSYEAVVALNVAPSLIHAGLLATGAKPGHPARFQPEFAPPTGTEIAIELRWRDAKDKVHSAPAGDWIRDIKTKKPIDMNWVFAGSQIVTDEKTGEKGYEADSGETICILNSPVALLDLPMYAGLSRPDLRTFEAFAERLPPAGTPVTILLKPILPASAKPAQTGPRAEQNPKPNLPPAEQAKLEKEAAEAAAKWLKLVDEEEYSRAWEAAAEEFKSKIDRREWVKSIGEVRKPLGKLKTRQDQSQSYDETASEAGRTQAFTIRYQLAFENGKKAAEMIILTPDRSKTWRVAAYRIDEEKRTERTETPPPPSPAGGRD